jgi:hypothetical protein
VRHIIGIAEIGCSGMDGIHVARDRNQRRILVNTVMYEILGNSSVTDRLMATREGLNSMELVG